MCVGSCVQQYVNIYYAGVFAYARMYLWRNSLACSIRAVRRRVMFYRVLTRRNYRPGPRRRDLFAVMCSDEFSNTARGHGRSSTYICSGARVCVCWKPLEITENRDRNAAERIITDTERRLQYLILWYTLTGINASPPPVSNTSRLRRMLAVFMCSDTIRGDAGKFCWISNLLFIRYPESNILTTWNMV